MIDDQDQRLQALRERARELELRGTVLERELEAELAKLTPRQRAFMEARWAERNSNTPVQ
jgi:hypothetical protein